MRGELILHVIHITGNRMIEAGIDSLSRESKLGGVMRGLHPFLFFLLYQGEIARLAKLEPLIRTWWEKSLSSLSAKY